MEVDRHFEVLDVAEPAGHALDLLNLDVEPLPHRVGDRMFVIGQDVVDVPTDRASVPAGCVSPRSTTASRASSLTPGGRSARDTVRPL